MKTDFSLQASISKFSFLCSAEGHLFPVYMVTAKCLGAIYRPVYSRRFYDIYVSCLRRPLNESLLNQTFINCTLTDRFKFNASRLSKAIQWQRIYLYLSMYLYLFMVLYIYLIYWLYYFSFYICNLKKKLTQSLATSAFVDVYWVRKRTPTTLQDWM